MTPEGWEQIKQIFEAALERTPNLRAAFVAEACANDDEMRAEVENLLSGDARASSFLERPALGTLPTLSPDGGRPTFSTGEIISRRFRVIRFLGKGGMGEVYEAQDLELGGRLALKTIRPEISSDRRVIARFKHEIELARRVTHPNVCRMFDLERHGSSAGAENGPSSEISFLTMELLEGETLAERLKRQGRFTPTEAFPIIQQMAEALAAAHEVGVVHRDFKPSNVLLANSSKGTRAVVTDFGLARIVASESAESAEKLSSSFTANGHIVGTPAYMAPEQLEGGKVMPASDIYNLGLVIYEMVTGARPFSDHAPFAGAFKRLKELPPAPRTLAPEVDPQWDAAIMRCLAIDPAQRFASVRAVVAALMLPSGALAPFPAQSPFTRSHEGIVAHSDKKTVAERPEALQSAGEKLDAPDVARPARKKPLLSRRAVIIGVFAAPALAAPAGVALLALRQVTTSVEVFDVENKTGQKDFDYWCNGLTMELMRRLTHLEGVQVIPLHCYRSNAPDRKPSRFSLDGIFQAEGGQTRLSVSLTDNRDGTLVWSESFDRERIEHPLELQSEIAQSTVRALDGRIVLGRLGAGAEQNRLFSVVARVRQILGLKSSPQVSASPTNSNVALDYYMRGHNLLEEGSPQSTHPAIGYFKKAVDLDPAFALAYSSLSDAYINLMNYNYAPGPELMKNAQTFAEQAVKLDPNLAEAYASLAVARQTSWDWPCAEEAYQKALQLKPTLARARRRYAGMMLQWGRFDEAIKQAQMAFEQDPYERSGPASLSMFFFYAGKPREAIDVLAPTVEGQEMPGARFSLGQFYARLGYQTSGAESAEYYRKALAQAKIIADVERRSASLSPSMTAPPSMADQLYALCYSMKGDDRSAEPHLQRLVNEMKLHRLSPVVVAFVYALQRQNAKALDLLEQGATWRDRRLLYIKVNPYFERLRDQPRFRALLSEIRLQ